MVQIGGTVLMGAESAQSAYGLAQAPSMEGKSGGPRKEHSVGGAQEAHTRGGNACLLAVLAEGWLGSTGGF